ncbi:efflux RND transporter permease subunit [Planctobacterium marinum]|uniref:efflux RND transporter permease subunit n=1 Tax=Planctobacterium marinum TaxID=1631968 RepID=UPI001E311BA1|nr:MMPL family transporter [Planctobacterium marinum]MCC2607023.1 MMPL family transporter [Planctobacterium marinum]
MRQFNRFVIAKPWLIISLFLAAALAAGYFAPQFKIDASANTLLMKNNKNYIQTKIVANRFNPVEFVLVAIKPKEQGVFSEPTFNLITQLSQQFAEMDRVSSTTSILNVPLLSQISELNANINPDDWTWQQQRYAPEKMATIFDNHPLFTDLLVNKSQTATAIQIVFQDNPALAKLDAEILAIEKHALTRTLSDQENAQIAQLEAQADVITQQLNKQRQAELQSLYDVVASYQHEAEFFIGGSHVLGQQLVEIISQDLQLFSGIIAATIAALLLVLFRQLRWVALPVACCGISVLLAIGVFGFFDLRTTVISANFIALQIILTLAIVIHLSVEYLQLNADNKTEQHSELVSQTIGNKFKPCLFAGLTTSVGFGSLIFSGIQPVISFGWMMIVAMGISICVSLLLFPALLMLFGVSKRQPEHTIISNLMQGCYGFVVRFPKLILLAGLLLALFAGSGFMRLNVENSFINYFAKSTRVHQELSFIDKEFGGSTPLDVIYQIQPAENANKDLILTAKDIQNLQVIQAVLRQYPAMGNTSSVVNFTQLAKQINNNKPLTEYELSALYMLLDDSLKDKLVQSYFSEEHQQLRISARIQDTTENFTRTKFLASLQQDIEAQGIDEQQFYITNLFVLYQDILKQLYQSQILTLGLVFVALTLVLLLVFGSIKVALIAVIPNILTTAGVLGVMGWLNIPLDIMTITIAAIAMGIAVDDTIHFVHRYLQGQKANSASDALKDTFHSTGFALFCTTVVIAAGFSLLSFSDFVPSVLFGLLTAVAMLLAFVIDLTLLPVLLKRFVTVK